jgi:hypothetical protein
MEADITQAQLALEKTANDQKASIQLEQSEEERLTRVFEQTVLELGRDFERACAQTERDAELLGVDLRNERKGFALQLATMKKRTERSIADSQIELDGLMMQLSNDRSAQLARLESEYARQMRDRQDDIAEVQQLCAEHLTTFDVMMAEATAERDKKREMFENRGCREEEQTIIAGLESHCALVTTRLGTVARELMFCRGRIQVQESEYNERFGAAPQVAVMKREGRRSALTAMKPLPPLHNSVKC